MDAPLPFNSATMILRYAVKAEAEAVVEQIRLGRSGLFEIGQISLRGRAIDAKVIHSQRYEGVPYVVHLVFEIESE